MKRRKDGYLESQITITVDGKKKQKSFYGKTQAEVNRKMIAYKGELEKGRFFCDVADEWQESHRKNIQYSTYEGYKKSLKDVKEVFKGYYINNITPNQIQNFIDKLAKTYAKQTVKTRLIVLNLIFNYAMLEYGLKYNPVIPVKLPPNLKSANRDISPNEDIEKIKNNKNNPKWLLPFFILYTGCRRSEALAVRYEDIDFINNRISINKKIEFHSTKPHLVEILKTKKSNRNIILLDTLKEILSQNKKGYIFKGKTGLLTQWELRTLLASYELNSTLHQLRHAYITMLYEADIDENIAMAQTGHSNIAVMRDIYTHIRNKKLEEAAKKLNEFNKY